jgi:LysR family transcriptional regulator, hydrogen peroxide-inducible genes activator
MNAHPSVQQLRYFCAVAQALNFSRAARDCYVTQSTISGGIQELEANLGLRLLDRTKRRVLLTPEGEAVAVIARDVLQRLADLQSVSRKLREPLFGNVRLGIIPTIAPFLLPAILPAVERAFPNLKLELHEGTTEDVLARLRQGQLDCGVIALPYAMPDLIESSLFFDRLFVALHKKNPLARQDRIDPGALASQRLLLLQDGHCLKDQALAACGLVRRATTDSYQAASLTTLVQLVHEGMGVTFVPEMGIPFFRKMSHALHFARLDDPKAVREIALCWRPGTAREKDLKAFADFLRQSHSGGELEALIR